MANNFYQINNEILKLNPYNKKDLALIQFNHYLCRKENLQRNKGELARGLFKLSYKVIEADTGLNRRSIREYVKWFEERNIIRFIEKSKSKGTPSIYAYTSVYDEKSEPNFVPNFEPNLSSNFNRFDSMGEPNSEPNSEPSKKEKEKENIKSSTSNIIPLASTKTRYTEKVLVEAIYRGKKVKAIRFNGNPPRYEGNKYEESNGYIYEIHKSIVQEVDNYWANTQYSECMGFDGKPKGDGRNDPFEEISVLRVL